MGKYPIHLPALSDQVRMHIALQGDVGVGMSQQLAKGLYIAPACRQVVAKVWRSACGGT